jgi:hypothetical protein
MTNENRTPTEADDSRASHAALHVIVNELRTAAQAGVVRMRCEEKGTPEDVEKSRALEDAADERANQAYVDEYTKRGGDACHQGWSCDMDPAGDWWVGNPDASDDEWFAEIAEWCWIDTEGECHDRPAPAVLDEPIGFLVLLILRDEALACPEAMDVNQAAKKMELDPWSVAHGIEEYGRCDTETWTCVAVDGEMVRSLYRK